MIKIEVDYQLKNNENEIIKKKINIFEERLIDKIKKDYEKLLQKQLLEVEILEYENEDLENE